MEVYKFGGASLKDAASVCNVVNIISRHQGQLVVVVSAMGKITDRFEELLVAYFNRKPYEELMQGIFAFHEQIVEGLDIPPAGKQSIRQELQPRFAKLKDKLSFHPFHSFGFHYDQIVSYGELLSSVVVSTYMQQKGIKNRWLDIRKCLITDKTYRSAKLDWDLSYEHLSEAAVADEQLVVTQGFIGGNLEGHTTTFGRDGSDYSASALAYLLDAQRVTVWKDVEGVYNADPRWYKRTQKLERISYKEAIELAFFGAQIIHPKTIKPLQNKHIPFYVKSFLKPDAPGTFINEIEENIALPPVYIRKTDQVLLSIQPTDFSFVVEHNLSYIFGIFAEHGIKINLMQNAAISFSACFDYHPQHLEAILEHLQDEFTVLYNTGLELITIRHYTRDAITEMTENRDIFIQQKSRKTVRFVLR